MHKMRRAYLPASRGLSRRGKNESRVETCLSPAPLIFAAACETSASRERADKQMLLFEPVIYVTTGTSINQFKKENYSLKLMISLELYFKTVFTHNLS